VLEPDRLRGEAERIEVDPGYLSHSHQHHAYRLRGQYAQQLDRLVKLFDRSDIHVVDSGDFFSRPEPVYDSVLDFLGLASAGYPQFERHNARPRSVIPSEIGVRLDEHFAPFDEQLAHWLAQVPSWRR
jgi:hypothetical protein